jgi:type II secretory pathway component GspD/PulD (secretin)
MKKTAKPSSISWLLAAVLIASCSTIEQESEAEVAQASDRLAKASQDFFGAPTQRPSGVQIQGGAFVGPERARTAAADRLPDSVRRRTDISIVSRTPLSLEEIAKRLNEVTNIPFVVNLGTSGQRVFVADTPQQTTDSLDAGSPSANANTDSEGVTSAASTQVMNGMPSDASSTASLRIRPKLSGSLGSVLDQLSAAFEVEWDYEDGRIVFRDYVTRSYQVTLLPSDIDTNFAAGPVSRANNLDFWGEVRQSVENLLSPGAKVTYGTSTGIITVTSRLADHGDIRRYIVALNEQLGQQVAFDVNVLSVILNNESDLSISLDAALREQNIDAQFSSSAGGFAGGGSFNIGVTSGSVDIGAVVRSLAKRGRVAIETRAGGITTNFQPVPISVTERIGYIASQQSNFDDNGNIVGTEVTTDTIEVGFVLLVLPRVLNSREVLLNYSISLSTNNGFQQLGDIQLPNTSQKVLDQQAIVQNGQSLVIAGFEERQSELERSGVPNENFLGLGGARSARTDRESTVIIITPRLLSRAGTR